MTISRCSFPFIVLVAVAAGCSSSPTPFSDAGLPPIDLAVFDVSLDTGVFADTSNAQEIGTPDTGVDAGGVDIGMDVATAEDSDEDVPTVTDAGTDVPTVDTGADVPTVTDTGVDVHVVVDAGVDVPTVVDTGVDTGVDAGCGAASPCATGLTCCGGTCRNLASDPANCGTCGSVCGTGLCGTAITAPMTTMPTGWTFNGTAAWDGTQFSGVLTSGPVMQTGTIWYQHPIVGDNFTAYFEFRIGFGGGFTRADGLAFAIQQTGASAVGTGGGGFGVVGLNGYAVELDDYNNMTCGDGNGNHTAVDSLGVCDTAVGVPNPLLLTAPLTGQAVSPDLFATVGDIGDGTWRSCRVQVSTTGGVTTASVTVNTVPPSDAGAAPILSNIVLAGAVPGTAYTFGFGGATGGLTDRHEIRNVTVSFATPRCL